MPDSDEEASPGVPRIPDPERRQCSSSGDGRTATSAASSPAPGGADSSAPQLPQRVAPPARRGSPEVPWTPGMRSDDDPTAAADSGLLDAVPRAPEMTRSDDGTSTAAPPDSVLLDAAAYPGDGHGMYTLAPYPQPVPLRYTLTTRSGTLLMIPDLRWAYGYIYPQADALTTASPSHAAAPVPDMRWAYGCLYPQVDALTTASPSLAAASVPGQAVVGRAQQHHQLPMPYQLPAPNPYDCYSYPVPAVAQTVPGYPNYQYQYPHSSNVAATVQVRWCRGNCSHALVERQVVHA